MSQRKCGKMKQETVNTHCKHPDCIYRLHLDNYIDCCYYAVIEYEARGCKISECTRYKKGTRKVKSHKDHIAWDLLFDNEEHIDDYK